MWKCLVVVTTLGLQVAAIDPWIRLLQFTHSPLQRCNDMTNIGQNRRNFLKATAATGAAVSVPYFLSGELRADETKAEEKNDRPVMASIGTGSRWGAVGPNAMRFADCVAVCDVDRNHAERAQGRVLQLQADVARVQRRGRREANLDERGRVQTAASDERLAHRLR